MNPKPLVSLNHFTVPVGISLLSYDKNAGGARGAQTIDAKQVRDYRESTATRIA
jgi:hypothetical protein